jgi:hypothetical protein
VNITARPNKRKAARSYSTGISKSRKPVTVPTAIAASSNSKRRLLLSGAVNNLLELICFNLELLWPPTSIDAGLES